MGYVSSLWVTTLKDPVARGPSKSDLLKMQAGCRGAHPSAVASGQRHDGARLFPRQGLGMSLTKMALLWEEQQKVLPHHPRSPGCNPDVPFKAHLCRLPSADFAVRSISQRCSKGSQNSPISLPLAIPSRARIASHPVHIEN